MLGIYSRNCNIKNYILPTRNIMFSKIIFILLNINKIKISFWENIFQNEI